MVPEPPLDSESYKTSMRDIARAAGVSVSAVSLAFKNSPKISPERRKAIVALAQRMGYHRDPRITELMQHLRSPRTQRTASRIAMLIPELTREQLAHYPPILGLIEGVETLAPLAGFGLEIIHLADPGMTPRRIRGILLARGIKGVIIAPFASGVARLPFDCAGLCVATAGYSIEQPRLHRACPNYLQMMDELLADCAAKGYRRIGLVMTYGEGGVGHKLFTSSFLFHQSKFPSAQRVPILPKPLITPETTAEWFRNHRPDVIISAGSVMPLLTRIGLRVPRDVAFASIDVSEPPRDAAGADHRYNLVGQETLELVLSQLNLNLTGMPENPKIVLVDSHRREGFTLPPKHGAAKTRRRVTVAPPDVPLFRGFLD
jgi:LacI family transcriptional regulator